MSSPQWTQMLTQLAAQGPLLLVYVGGIIVSIIFWRRAPRAAMLTVIASAILLATALAYPPIQSWVISNRGATGSAASIGQSLMMISMMFNFVRAAALGLLVWAVFAGRPREAEFGAFPMAPRVGAPPASGPPPLR
jgi:hypothetical protein